MSKSYANTENKLTELFRKKRRISYQGNEYKIIKIGKPRPNRGECKTDIYIFAESSKEFKEFKISVKQDNAEFVESKVSLERAEEIFGAEAQKVITSYTYAIKNEFTNENIVFFDKKHPTRAGSITLGWKFDLVKRRSGKKSGLVRLNEQQQLEVYSGQNSSVEKRNCMVNGELIENSGAANFILELSSGMRSDADHYFKQIVPINNYIEDKDVYFACKALNYRVEEDKWDSDRPLAVYIDWKLDKDNKLSGKIRFDKPLEIKGDEIGTRVRGILKKLGINKNKFYCLEKFLKPNVKYFKIEYKSLS